MINNALWLRQFNYKREPVRSLNEQNDFLQCVDSHVTLGKLVAGSKAKIENPFSDSASELVPLSCYEGIV